MGDVIDIGDRRIAAILRLLAVQPGEALDVLLSKLALGIEWCYLGTLFANLGDELSRRLSVEISVNRPG